MYYLFFTLLVDKTWHIEIVTHGWYLMPWFLFLALSQLKILTVCRYQLLAPQHVCHNWHSDICAHMDSNASTQEYKVPIYNVHGHSMHIRLWIARLQRVHDCNVLACKFTWIWKSLHSCQQGTHFKAFMPATLPCTCGTKARSMQKYEVTDVSITKQPLVFGAQQISHAARICKQELEKQQHSVHLSHT